MPLCFVCKSTIDCLQLFRSHIRYHGIERKMHVYCVDGACGFKQFKNLSNYVRHFKELHLNMPQQEALPVFDNDDNERPDDMEIADEILERAESPAEDFDTDPENLVNFIRTEVDLYVSRLYGNQRIPRNEVQGVIDYTQGLIKGVGTVLEPLCLDLAAKANAEPEVTFQLQDIFSALKSPFQDLRSEYMRLKTFKKGGTYIEPIPIILGSKPGVGTSNSGHVVEMEDLSAVHIPLKTILQKYLEQPGIMPKILKFREWVSQQKNYFCNFMNAERWRKLAANKPNLWPLFVFSDDFEVTNCLGSHRTVHKITGVYVSMPFLPPELTFRLQNIFITYLHHSSDRKLFGNEKLYKCVIEEFIFLHDEGITIETPAFSGNIRFAFALMLGDNLGLHQILGFVGGFMANFPCRICKIPRDTMVMQCEDKLDLWRDRNNYKVDVEIGDVSSTGIEELCAFNEIPGFHCTEAAGFDTMHDILEGCCLFTLKLVINHFVKEAKIFDLKFLNRRIEFFDYGLIDKTSKPTLLSFDKKGKLVISMSASETLTFTKYFGLLIGDRVSEGNEYWELYILLRKILDVIMSPIIPKEHIDLLSALINDHHSLFLKLSPKKRLKNKMHHMLHYPRLISLFGPPIFFWSMRFEAKHRFPKSIALSISSRRNITLSIAIRAQQCFHSYLKFNAFIGNQFKSGPAKSCKMSDLDGFHVIPNGAPPGDTNISTVPWVDIKGIMYKEKMILVTDYQDHLPVFSQIDSILIFDTETAAFVCSRYETLCFDIHYFAYEVIRDKDSYVYVQLSELCHNFPTVINVSGGGKIFVTYKYGL